ncbi:hypothetical protein AURDEDRAFT_160990 [Auricularia subglabra TFB-10046 SS5]|nr:hypothetical protein AURDEDRAFT_160990 [Auricularia subglabra TFB-10046 SS5]
MHGALAEYYFHSITRFVGGAHRSTFLSDYFGILLDAKIEGFPFNVVSDLFPAVVRSDSIPARSDTRAERPGASRSADASYTITNAHFMFIFRREVVPSTSSSNLSTCAAIPSTLHRPVLAPAQSGWDWNLQVSNSPYPQVFRPVSSATVHEGRPARSSAPPPSWSLSFAAPQASGTLGKLVSDSSVVHYHCGVFSPPFPPGRLPLDTWIHSPAVRREPDCPASFCVLRS